MEEKQRAKRHKDMIQTQFPSGYCILSTIHHIFRYNLPSIY